MCHFHPQITVLQGHIHAGEIGALMDVSCYCVSFARLFAGVEPSRAFVRGCFDPSTGVDLTLAGTLEFAGNITAQLLCSFETEGSDSAEIIGTEGK